MSAPVRLEMTIDELRDAIAESMRFAMVATGHRIVNAAGEDETIAKLREMANNVAGGLMAFVVEDMEAA